MSMIMADYEVVKKSRLSTMSWQLFLSTMCWQLSIKAYITDNEVRDIVEKKEYSRFATNPKITMADFKELNGWRDIVPEYVKDYVSINTYM